MDIQLFLIQVRIKQFLLVVILNNLFNWILLQQLVL